MSDPRIGIFYYENTIGKAKDILQSLIRAKEAPLQNDVLPKLKAQLADTKGIFKGKERKALSEQIQQTEQEISAKLDKLPDILKEDGYPDVQIFMRTFREMKSVVEQHNRDLAAWERQVKEKRRPPKPPEKVSIRNRFRQLQEQGRQQNPRKKSFDRDSR